MPDPSHTYAASTAVRTARLTVTDPRGASDSATIAIAPGDRAPEVTIDAPASFRSGQSVRVRGSAVDPEDGPLPTSKLRWSSRLVHVDHTHDPDESAGVSEITLRARTDHDSDSYFEVTLTATDSGGASSSKTVQIRPRRGRSR